MGDKRWCIQGNWTGRVWDKSRRSLALPLPKKRNIIFLNFITLLWGGGAFCYFCSMLGAFLGRASKEGGGIKYFSYVIKYREGDGDFTSRLCHTSKCTGVVCVLILAYMYIATRTQVHICNN